MSKRRELAETETWVNLPRGRVGDLEQAKKLLALGFAKKLEDIYEELPPDRQAVRDRILSKPQPEGNDDWACLPTPQAFIDRLAAAKAKKKMRNEEVPDAGTLRCLLEDDNNDVSELPLRRADRTQKSKLGTSN